MKQAYGFATLPDYLEHGLDVVFIGINPGLFSVQRGHYFARASSRFWPAFSASKLSEGIRRSLGVGALKPEHDAVLQRFGIGLTDVVKRPSANAGELRPEEFQKWVPLLVEKLQSYAPRVACFHGLTAFRPFLIYGLKCLERKPLLGVQPEMVGATRLFVVPNPSPANAHFTVADQIAWYDQLAGFLADCRRSVVSQSEVSEFARS